MTAHITTTATSARATTAKAATSAAGATTATTATSAAGATSTRAASTHINKVTSFISLARLTTIVTLVITIAALLLCAGCSYETQQVAMTPASSAEIASSATASNATQATQTSKAMVLVAAKGNTSTDATNSLDIMSQPLLVDIDTGAIFYPSIPTNELFNEQGQPIEITSLQPGNVLEISGNGIMLESYPGQYPGISTARVIEEGSPEDVEPYAAEIANIGLSEEADTNFAPHATLEYKTENGQVSVILNAVAYDWTNETGNKIVNELYVVNENGELISDLPDARVSEDVSATVEFVTDASMNAGSEQPQFAIVASYPIEQTATGFRTTATNESLASLSPNSAPTANGKVACTIEPGNLYIVCCQFAQGTATYAFITYE